MKLRAWFDSFYERVWNTQDEAAIHAAIDELVAEDCKVFGLPERKDIARAGFKQIRDLFLHSFDGARITIEDALEVDDRIAMRATCVVWKGGREHMVSGAGIARVRDGQIVEAWNQWDFLGLLTQLGVVAPDALPTAILALRDA